MTDDAARRRGRPGRSLALVAAGALLTLALGGILLLADLRFDGGRVIHAALGTQALAEACRAPLERRLVERGFQPDDVVLGPEPTLGSPWDRERRFGDSFTFRDGAAAERVDGVMACVVTRDGVTVEIRVAANPHRAA